MEKNKPTIIPFKAPYPWEYARKKLFEKHGMNPYGHDYIALLAESRRIVVAVF